MLQLLPLTLTDDAQSLADDALTAAGPRSRRVTLNRPFPQTLKLLRSNFAKSPVVLTVGDAVTAAYFCRAPILHIPNGLPTRGEIFALKKARTVHLVTPSRLAAARYARFGIRFASTTVIRPDTRLPKPRPARDELLRAELGLLPSHRLVYAPGAVTRSSGHHLALWATSILAFATGSQWKLLITGDGPDIPRLFQFAGANDPSCLLVARDVLTDYSVPAGLAAGDLAIDFGTGPRDLRPVLQAQALGLPLLVAPRSSAAEIADPASITPELTPRVLARKIAELTDTTPSTPPTRDTAIPTWKSLLAQFSTRSETARAH